MRTFTVKTNNGARPLVSFAELPEEVRKEFDYMDDRPEDQFSDRFVKYCDVWYDAADSEIAPDDLKKLGWDSWITDSYWSGICFRWFDREGSQLDSEVVVGRFTVSS